MSSPIPDAYKLLFKSTVVISRVNLALQAYIKHSVTKLFRGAAAQYKQQVCAPLSHSLLHLSFDKVEACAGFSRMSAKHHYTMNTNAYRSFVAKLCKSTRQVSPEPGCRLYGSKLTASSDAEGQQRAACGYKLFVSRTGNTVTFEAAPDHFWQGLDAVYAQYRYECSTA